MKVLYGICGIGNGHLFRQLPLLKYLLDEGHQILVFAYDKSEAYLKPWEARYPRMKVQRVEVPYVIGKDSGLDFSGSAGLEVNQKFFFHSQCQAMAVAESFLGRPDLVISDYEPTVAQYAYAWDAPLVTIDQQSKFLAGSFSEPLAGCYYRDEVMRLRMFFPKASLRLACSFFSVKNQGEVQVLPPILRDGFCPESCLPVKDRVLCYLSAQQFERQSVAAVMECLGAFPALSFHLFTPKIQSGAPRNVRTYQHGDPAFDRLLKTASGIVSTAGHSLLSEAMALGIPVLALPLPLYEQQINGATLGQHGFGLCTQELSKRVLGEFLDSLEVFTQNIRQDRTVLLRGNGFHAILNHLSPFIEKPGLARV